MHVGGHLSCSALLSEHDLKIGPALASDGRAPLGHDCSLDNDLPSATAYTQSCVIDRRIGSCNGTLPHPEHASLLAVRNLFDLKPAQAADLILILTHACCVSGCPMVSSKQRCRVVSVQT